MLGMLIGKIRTCRGAEQIGPCERVTANRACVNKWESARPGPKRKVSFSATIDALCTNTRGLSRAHACEGKSD